MFSAFLNQYQIAMIIHQTTAGSLSFDESTPAIIATFTGFMKSEQFQEFMKVGLTHLEKYLKRHKNVLWLADTTSHKVQPKADTEWVATTWTPQAVRAGLTHIAFVIPKDAFAQLSVQNYTEKASNDQQKEVTIQMFPDVESAKNWYSKSVRDTQAAY